MHHGEKKTEASTRNKTKEGIRGRSLETPRARITFSKNKKGKQESKVTGRGRGEGKRYLTRGKKGEGGGGNQITFSSKERGTSTNAIIKCREKKKREGGEDRIPLFLNQKRKKRGRAFYQFAKGRERNPSSKLKTKKEGRKESSI